MSVVVLLFISALSAFYFLYQRGEIEHQQTHHSERLRWYHDLMISVLNTETAVRGYLITRDQKFLEPYHTGLEQLNTLSRVNEHAIDSKSLLEKINSYLEHTRHLIEAPDSSTHTIMGESKWLVDEIRRSLQRLEDSVVIEKQNIDQHLVAQTFYLQVFSFLSIAFSALLTYFLYRNLFSSHHRLKDLEMRLIKEARTAQEASEAKSFFVANISHEIRTPMNGIVGVLQLLKKSPLNFDQKKWIQLISDSSTTLLTLLNNVIDLSKIESKKIELEIAQVNLNETVRSVVSLLQPQAEAKSLELSFHCAHNELFVKADPLRLRQIVLNLIQNAIKFTLVGHVRVRLKILSASSDKMGVALEVEDTGIGISTEHLDTIFESFSQSDSSITREFGGSGLGLAICKELTSIMGGSLDVISQKDRGSTFTFTCSFEKSAPPETSFETEDTLFQFSPYGVRVLVAEDNPINQEVFETMLSHLGVSFKIVQNGQEALETLLREKFDLILMDCHMPVMDGFETTRSIRQLPSLEKNIPIIATTAAFLKGDRERCLESGMNDYLPKPFTLADLSSLLKEHLAHRLDIEQMILDRFNEFKAMGVERATKLMKDLRAIFENETQPLIVQLEQYILSSERGEAMKKAHLIKSHFAQLNSRVGAWYAEQIELKVHTLTVQECLHLVEVLQKNYLVTARALNRINL